MPTLQEMLDWRGIEQGDQCPECGGSGWKSYSNTATYHKDVVIAGQAFTTAVCDVCWGSGDRTRHWPSHLEFEHLTAKQRIR